MRNKNFNLNLIQSRSSPSGKNKLVAAGMVQRKETKKLNRTATKALGANYWGMRYLLVTVGTRGDAEPFIALASELKRRGHEVNLASTEGTHDASARRFDRGANYRGALAYSRKPVSCGGSLSLHGWRQK